ncbi:MAG TPA: hypothetical protein VGO96_18890 [Pyrinomonadaceae bacterium]|nr:hypothetical protein [Pyrinomonadaceae bacterium]
MFETMCIGLLGGFFGGGLLFFTIMLKGASAAREMSAESSASYECAAGSAAIWLAPLCIPAGVLFGLGLGGFFLWRKSVAERRPLP